MSQKKKLAKLHRREARAKQKLLYEKDKIKVRESQIGSSKESQESEQEKAIRDESHS